MPMATGMGLTLCLMALQMVSAKSELKAIEEQRMEKLQVENCEENDNEKESNDIQKENNDAQKESNVAEAEKNNGQTNLLPAPKKK